MWVLGVWFWMWVRGLRGVVGRDGGFSDVCGRLVAGVVGPVWAGCWWWLWLDCLVVVVEDSASKATNGAGTPVNRSQEAKDTARATQHTERAHR